MPLHQRASSANIVVDARRGGPAVREFQGLPFGQRLGFGGGGMHMGAGNRVDRRMVESRRRGSSNRRRTHISADHARGVRFTAQIASASLFHRIPIDVDEFIPSMVYKIMLNSNFDAINITHQ
jgi:hypothetical protein